MCMNEYDFIAIGTGSGLDVANVVANQGQAVAVVEKGPLGGTCLNRGCIPSKRLLYHADIKETIDRSEAFHIESEITNVDFESIVNEVNEDIASDAASIREGIKSADSIDLFEGTAAFVDDKTIEIQEGQDAGKTITADEILIAAGTRPTVPDIAGINSVDYLTSQEALELASPPEHLVVIGGGYIAAELAHFFGSFGSEISIIGRRQHLLPHVDEEVAKFFTAQYSDRFNVYTGYEAVEVNQAGETISVTACPYPSDESNGGSIEVSGTELLIAAGRRPNTDLLEMENTAVETDEQGYIEVNKYLQTSVSGNWALGDIVGEYLLKHNANHEAKTVVDNLYGEELTAVDYTAMPYAVFGSPEVAGVGDIEQDLDSETDDYATRTYQYEDTARGAAMKQSGLVKVIIDFDGNIRGCHIAGPDASTVIQEVVVAMKAGSGTIRDIRDSVHIHPALSEVVQRAFSGQFVPAGKRHEHHHH